MLINGKIKIRLKFTACTMFFASTLYPVQATELQRQNYNNRISLNNSFNERWGASTINNNKPSKQTLIAYAPASQTNMLPILQGHGAKNATEMRDNNDTSPIKKSNAASLTPELSAAASPIEKECEALQHDVNTIKSVINAAAKKHDVDEKFAEAIAWAESRFNKHLNSPKGARGTMQLMPPTAAQYGVQDICDPHQNIDAGVRHLRSLLDEFENPLLAAAAYNAGSSRIYEYGGVPPFKETVGYVAEVVNFMIDRPMPASKAKKKNTGDTIPVSQSTTATGVIPVQKSGKFVGGVMHF